MTKGAIVNVSLSIFAEPKTSRSEFGKPKKKLKFVEILRISKLNLKLEPKLDPNLITS